MSIFADLMTLNDHENASKPKFSVSKKDALSTRQHLLLHILRYDIKQRLLRNNRHQNCEPIRMRKSSDILQVRKDYVPQSCDAESDTIFLRPFSLRLLKLNKNVQAFQSNKTNQCLISGNCKHVQIS